MKKLILAALTAASIASASIIAFAADAEGVVATVDLATGTVILEDGSTWTASEDIDLSAVAPGDAIKVTYEDGTTVLTSVEKM